MTEGQITILNQMLIISGKFGRNLPISNSKPSLLNVNIYSKFGLKIPCYLLKLSSGNENMGVFRADNSVKN